jgi:hypothetical protein
MGPELKLLLCGSYAICAGHKYEFYSVRCGVSLTVRKLKSSDIAPQAVASRGLLFSAV